MRVEPGNKIPFTMPQSAAQATDKVKQFMSTAQLPVMPKATGKLAPFDHVGTLGGGSTAAKVVDTLYKSEE